MKNFCQESTLRWLVLALGFIAISVSGLLLEGQAQGDGVIKMGFVRVDDLFVRFEGTNEALEAFIEERDQTEAELANLQDQLDNGEISTAEFLVLQSQLLARLDAVDTQFSAAITTQIVNATQQLGAAKDLDLITPLNNVVVHANSSVVSDVTDIVLDIMNADFADEEFDFDTVSVNPQPLQTVGFFNAQRIFSNYKGTNVRFEELSADLDELEMRREQVTQDRDNGDISQAEFVRLQGELNNEQVVLEQTFVNDIITEISEAVGEVGDAVGYDLVSSRTNVVLHFDRDTIGNITNQVTAFMNARFDGESYDFNQVPLPSGAPRKMGYINADRVFIEFEGTDEAIEQFRARIEEAQAELEALQEDLNEGNIEPLDAFNQQEALEAELNELDAQLSAQITDLIVDTADTFGEAEGYDLITPLADVVLYHNPDVIDDLTDQIIALMNDGN